MNYVINKHVALNFLIFTTLADIRRQPFFLSFNDQNFFEVASAESLFLWKLHSQSMILHWETRDKLLKYSMRIPHTRVFITNKILCAHKCLLISLLRCLQCHLLICFGIYFLHTLLLLLIQRMFSLNLKSFLEILLPVSGSFT